jgi:hypothetical protein
MPNDDDWEPCDDGGDWAWPDDVPVNDDDWDE